MNSTIVNPSFDAQTKETLKTNKGQFKHYINLDSVFRTTVQDEADGHDRGAC